MPKTRVYELAKQLSIENKRILTRLEEMGITGKTASSGIEDEIVQKLKEGFAPPKPQPQQQPKQQNQQSHQQRPQQNHQQGQQQNQQSQQNQQNNQQRNSQQRSNQQQQRPKQPYQQNNQNQQGQQGQQQRYGQGQNQGQRDMRRDNRPQENRSNENHRNENRSSENRSNESRPHENRSGENRYQDRGQRPDNRQQYQGQNQGQYQGQGQRPPYNQQRNPQQRSENRPYQGQGQQQSQQRQGGGQGGFNKDRPMQKDDDYNRNKGQGNKSGGNRPGGQNRPGGNKPGGNKPGGSKVQVLQPVREEIDLSRRKRDSQQKDKPEVKQERGKQKKPTLKPIPKPEPPKREFKKPEPQLPTLPIQLPVVMTVKELAELLKKSGGEIVKLLMKQGKMLTLNQEIDFETAANVCMEYEYDFEPLKEIDILEENFKEENESDDLKQHRPPVVVVMGHVDHGKTSLLDSIRSTSVTTSEAGGITQHIGAYTVSIDGKPITFIDTPGHEAFTAMRMRGAQVTDIAILVVAADDGVMPQTIEAINHARAANVDIIVAINKIDKANANPDRVKQELTEHGILVEDWGGDIISVPVSATKRTGIDHLLEMIILVSEMKELKANANKRARGTVIEALLDKGRGPVATVLVQDGTLNVGDYVVAGGAFGRIRAMMDDKGLAVKSAGPSMPVEILGLSDVPKAGDAFNVAVSDKQARSVAESLASKSREELLRATPQKVSLDDLFSQIQAGNVKDLNIVVKADVQGSAEAVKNSLERLSNSEVRIRIIHSGVGAITETDVMLASASNAIVIGFNVRPEAASKAVAELEKVDIRLYRVIYNAIEDMTAAMKGLLDPVFKEKVLGHAEIRQLFKASGIGTIAGSYITDGKITRNAQVRITRDGKVIYEGTIDTLKRIKDDVKEVNAGYECGILFNKFNDIKEGDRVEAFVMEEIER